MADTNSQQPGPKAVAKCHTCGKEYSSKKTLYRHRRIKHPSRKPAAPATSVASFDPTALVRQAERNSVYAHAHAHALGNSPVPGLFSDVQHDIRDGIVYFQAKLNLDHFGRHVANFDSRTTADAPNNIQASSQNNHPKYIKQEVDESNHIQHIEQPPVILTASTGQVAERPPAVHQAPVQTSFSCDLCDRTFNSPLALDNHNNDKHKTVRCPQCNKPFRFQSALAQHQRVKHASLQVRKAPEQHQSVQQAPPQVKKEPEQYQSMMKQAPLQIRLAPAISQEPEGSDIPPMPNMHTHPEEWDDWMLEHCPNSDNEYCQLSSYTDTEEDSDEDDDLLDEIVWPEYGEKKPVLCLADPFGCDRLFHKAWEMLYHIENDHQTHFPWNTPDEVFKMVRSGDEIRELYNRETNLWYCPNCKGTQQGICKSLSLMVRHAESNLCDLKVCSGPIAQLKEAVECYAVQKHIRWEMGY